MAGRLFSYVDTQITRLGGPNWNQLPINRPHAPVNDMLRDGFHQHGDHIGVAPYKPNSLDGGCPFFAGAEDRAFEDTPVRIPETTRVRANPASFDQIRQLAAMVRASGPNPDGSAKRWFARQAMGMGTRGNPQ